MMSRLGKDIPVPVYYNPSNKFVDPQIEAIHSFNKHAELEEERAFVSQIIIERDLELKRKEKYSGKSFVDRGIGTTPLIKQLKQDFESYLK